MADPSSARTALWTGGAAVIASAGVAYLPWVDLRGFQVDIAWNGFGHFQGGAEYRMVGDQPLRNSPAWVILVAVLIAGLALVAATRNRSWLRLVSVAASAVALATAVACLVRPELLAGQVLEEFGIEPIGARAIVNTTWLWSEVAITGIFTLTIVGVIVAARRTPPAA